MKSSHYLALVPLLLSLFALIAVPASAELENEIMHHLISPESVMRFNDQIDLSEAQRQSITSAIQQTQAEATEIQWQMQSISRALIESLAVTPIDKEIVMKRARAVMEIEQKVKLRHLSLLVEIRNQLRPEQVERLRELASR